MAEEERIVCPWCQGDALVPVGPPFPGDARVAYCQGVNDLLRAAREARDALDAGARRPQGTGMNTVRSFVDYLAEQAEKLKEKT